MTEENGYQLEGWVRRMGIEIPEIYDGIAAWWVPNGQFTQDGVEMGTYINRWDPKVSPGRYKAVKDWIALQGMQTP
jgi:hypothetical protein